MRPAGLEPSIGNLAGTCSIQLSYGRMALDMHRVGLEPATGTLAGTCSSIELPMHRLGTAANKTIGPGMFAVVVYLLHNPPTTFFKYSHALCVAQVYYALQSVLFANNRKRDPLLGGILMNEGSGPMPGGGVYGRAIAYSSGSAANQIAAKKQSKRQCAKARTLRSRFPVQ